MIWLRNVFGALSVLQTRTHSMDGPTAVSTVSQDISAEQRQLIQPNPHQHMQEHHLAGGLRQIMPGTTVLWGRRIPGQTRQLGPSQQGRLVAGVPLQAVIASTSSLSASINSKPRVVSVSMHAAAANRGIAAVRHQQQVPAVQALQQQTAQQQQQQHIHMQQQQQLEEQQGSTEGPLQHTAVEDAMEAESESDESSEGHDLSSESEGDASEQPESDTHPQQQQQQGLQEQHSWYSESAVYAADAVLELEDDELGTESKRRRLEK